MCLTDIDPLSPKKKTKNKYTIVHVDTHTGVAEVSRVNPILGLNAAVTGEAAQTCAYSEKLY